MRRVSLMILVLWVSAAWRVPADERIGPAEGGGFLVSTKQLIRPAGQVLEVPGRPVDLVLSPDGTTLFAKDNTGLVVIDAATWTVRQKLKLPHGGASMHGIAVTRDGKHVFVTDSSEHVEEALIGLQGQAAWAKGITLPGPPGGRKAGLASYPCGVALSADEKTAYVCLSRNNALGIVDLSARKLAGTVPVGVSPYGVVLSNDGKTAYVSNFGGRRPTAGEKTAKSSNTDTLVDQHGASATGTVSVIDLSQMKETAQIAVGLHPAGMVATADGRRVYVANSNSDTVSIIDTVSAKVTETINVRPDEKLPFGSASNALALTPDGKTLLVANGGNNAVAVVSLGEGTAGTVAGFIPTGWYPGAVATDGKHVYVADVKGVGSRAKTDAAKGPADAGTGGEAAAEPVAPPSTTAWSVKRYLGTFEKVAMPNADELKNYTARVLADGRVPQALAAMEKGESAGNPVPVPKKPGEKSAIDHVVYVIKENRTYDQVLGDLPKGNNDPKLCVFGRSVTPNHHALAETFVTLDNFYCNGVVSADGHQWATEGTAVAYLEKAFGGFTRSYPYGGDDPLAIASSGFIWDNALLHGLSFRNYGEMALTEIVPKSASFDAVWRDYVTKAGKISFKPDVQIESLRKYTCPNYPGWNLKLPDVLRMDVFLKEFREFEKNGDFPNLVIVYLPCDHTSGAREGSPTPAAQVADNDLALGRLVDALSHSKYWATTCLFAVEDDPQAGFDHVDGHRSLCLVASPYTKRGQVVSTFYNQTSVLHTMELMLGLPPMTQMDAMAPAMDDAFSEKADLSAYTAIQNKVPLDQMNRAKAALVGRDLELAQLSDRQPLEKPDQCDEDTLNRIIWHAVKGADAAYPAEWAGAHGKGLGKLGLKATGADDDD